MFFNPKRLDIARKRRGISAKEMSEKAGVTSVTISRIKAGENQPDIQTVKALSTVLKYPIDFFYQDDLDIISKESASFRSLKATTAKERHAALSASSLAFEVNDWIDNKFNLPETNIPDLSDLSSEPEMAALNLRSMWGLGERPVGNLIRLLESKGVRFFSLFENNQNVDAYCCWRRDTPFIFLNTMKSAERKRFDIAHELGHLALHYKNNSGHSEAEREADAFASAFLMPSSDIFSNLPKFIAVDSLIHAKKRWRVSLMALAYRLHKLGIVSDWQYRTLCIQASKKGYRKKEPNPIDPEFSGLFETVFRELWNDGFTINKIGKELKLPLDELHHLINGLMRSNTDTGNSAQKTSKPSLTLV